MRAHNKGDEMCISATEPFAPEAISKAALLAKLEAH